MNLFLSLKKKYQLTVKSKKLSISFFDDYDDFKNHQIRTFRVNSIFSAIASISGKMSGNKKENYHKNYDNSLKVEPEGFEPSSKRALARLSTCLVFV